MPKAATKKKAPVKHYLDALLSPRLGSDRRYALTLMAKVHIVKGATKRSKATVSVKDPYDLAVSLKCVNCEKNTNAPKLYCSMYCSRFGAMVRYVRKCVDLDKVKKPHIQEDIGINLLMLSGGGYPAAERKISKELREQIFERDGHKCLKCGKHAEQIDHIKSNSSDPQNLASLCADCNRKKAFKTAVPASKKQADQIDRMLEEMATRIAAVKPLLLCDDYEQWNSLQGKMMGARKRRYRELQEEAEDDFEDVDGYLRDAMEKDD